MLWGVNGSISFAGASNLISDTTNAQAGADAGAIILISSGDVLVSGDEDAPFRVNGSAGPLAGGSALFGIIGQSISLNNVEVQLNSAGLTPGLADGGVVLQAADTIALNRTAIANTSTGAITPATTSVDGRVISLQDSSFTSSATGSAGTGPIALTAIDSVQLLGNSSVTSDTAGSGAGANVTLIAADGSITVAGNDTTGGARISSSSTGLSGGGDAGQVLIQAADVVLDQATIDASSASGRPGFIAVEATNLEVSNAFINISTASNLMSSGSVLLGLSLTAINELSISGSVVSSSTTGSTDARPIQLQSDRISIANTLLAASTSGAGSAGLVGVNGRFNDFGEVLVPAVIDISDTQITSTSTGDGSFGQVAISGQTVGLTNSSIAVETSSALQGSQDLAAAQILAIDEVNIHLSTVSLRTTAASDAGRIGIGAERVNITSSSINSSSTGTAVNGAGTAGQIRIGSTSLSGDGSILLMDSQVNSDTTDGGGGLILIEADLLTVEGRDTRVSTNSAGSADAGAIGIRGQQVTVGGGATIASSATGAGNSNRIDISGLSGVRIGTSYSDPPTIVTTTSEQSAGGDIVVISGGTTSVQNASVAASAGAAGNGGNIIIGTNGLVLARAEILARAEGGNGGQIDLNLFPGAVTLIDGESAISADSQSGSAGSVEVDAPNTGIRSALTPQSTSVAPRIPINRDVCRPGQLEDRPSTFFVVEDSVREAAPDEYLPASSVSTNAIASGCR